MIIKFLNLVATQQLILRVKFTTFTSINIRLDHDIH